MSDGRLLYAYDFLILGGVCMRSALVDEANGTTDSTSG
jgi:hypothetical protein